MKTVRKRLLKLGLVLLVLVIGVPAFYYSFFLRLIRVPTASMANTIIPGDHLVVKKRAFGEINRGDVIVFRYPKDTTVHYLQRVIGLPRETIEVRGRLVYINGQELKEERVTVKPDYDLLGEDGLQELSTEGTGPYRVYFSSQDGDESGMPPASEDYPFGSKGAFQIHENEYFVMGDNRDNSEDSRFWGPLPRTLVFGKATMIYWSVLHDKEGNESIRWNRIFSKIK